jgi:hypothetical protein
LICSDTLDKCLDTKNQTFVIWPWISMLTIGILALVVGLFVLIRCCVVRQHLKRFQYQVHPVNVTETSISRPSSPPAVRASFSITA